MSSRSYPNPWFVLAAAPFALPALPSIERPEPEPVIRSPERREEPLHTSETPLTAAPGVLGPVAGAGATLLGWSPAFDAAPPMQVRRSNAAQVAIRDAAGSDAGAFGPLARPWHPSLDLAPPPNARSSSNAAWVAAMNAASSDAGSFGPLLPRGS